MSRRKRVLLKLSGEALKGSSENIIDVPYMQQLVKELVALHQAGLEMVIVIGGGNIWRGVTGEEMGLERANADYMGMVATIINGMALGNSIEQQGVPVRVLSSLEIPRVSELFIRKRALKHLEKNRIVICVAGTGNPFFSTDSAAVLRSLELGCEVVIKATNVDGVYDKHPKEFPDAKKYDQVTYDEVLAKNLQIMDPSAVALAKDEQMPIYVCHIDTIDTLAHDTLTGTLVEL